MKQGDVRLCNLLQQNGYQRIRKHISLEYLVIIYKVVIIMTKLNKILKPKIEKDLIKDEDFPEILREEKELYKSFVCDYSMDYIVEEKLDINGCYFKNVVFNECDFQNIDLLDVVFENCDLSNVNFSEGSIHRTEFKNCKLVGANFSGCNMQNVLFKQSLGRYSNFSYGKLKALNFDNCNLETAAFSDSEFNKICFSECNLENSDFMNVNLKGIDFTDSDISRILLTGKELKGVTVSMMQAVELSQLLGLIIK